MTQQTPKIFLGGFQKFNASWSHFSVEPPLTQIFALDMRKGLDKDGNPDLSTQDGRDLLETWWSN